MLTYTFLTTSYSFINMVFFTARLDLPHAKMNYNHLSFVFWFLPIPILIIKDLFQTDLSCKCVMELHHIRSYYSQKQCYCPIFIQVLRTTQNVFFCHLIIFNHASGFILILFISLRFRKSAYILALYTKNNFKYPITLTR